TEPHVSIETFAERFAVKIFHHEIRRAVFARAGVERADDVRMLERLDDSHLTHEAIAEILRARLFGFEDLDRDGRVRERIFGEEDPTHRAFAKQTTHDVLLAVDRAGFGGRLEFDELELRLTRQLFAIERAELCLGIFEIAVTAGADQESEIL